MICLILYMTALLKRIVNKMFSFPNGPLSNGKIASISYKADTRNIKYPIIINGQLLMSPAEDKKVLTVHPFHIVDSSPWPFIAATGALELTFGMVLYMYRYTGGKFLLLLGFVTVSYVMYVWWRDVIRESMLEDKHTKEVQDNLRMGVRLFIVSEVMFFFSLFWAFFYLSGTPGFEPVSAWPPTATKQIEFSGIACINTFILVCSGGFATWAHHAIVRNNNESVFYSLLCTIILAIVFLSIQYYEYKTSPFGFSDGAYGSCFYMLTGFHGFHVFVGAVALFVCMVRTALNHFTAESHLGLESAIWYWHFVDVVWLFLYLAVYWWGA